MKRIISWSPSQLCYWRHHSYSCGFTPQVHCEDHRRHDSVVPHGHHQGVHHQPLPGRPHIQTEEHQQVGADPTQPTAVIQVRCPGKMITKQRKYKQACLPRKWRPSRSGWVDKLSDLWLSQKGIWTRWYEWEWRKCSLRQWEEIQLVIWHKPIIKLSGKYFPPDFNSQVLYSPCLFWNTSRPKIAKNSKLYVTAASFNILYFIPHLFCLNQRCLVYILPHMQ